MGHAVLVRARRGNSLNRLAAYTLATKLKERIQRIDSCEADGSVDVLITGCEASLWVGEQFASDLHRVFPGLKVTCLSANKLLGQLGQSFPTPQVGSPYSPDDY